MKKIIIVFAGLLMLTLTLVSCKAEKKDQKIEHKKEQAEILYQCPMKCEKEKTYPKEGKCPVCEMKLRKKTLEEHENHEGHEH